MDKVFILKGYYDEYGDKPQVITHVYHTLKNAKEHLASIIKNDIELAETDDHEVSEDGCHYYSHDSDNNVVYELWIEELDVK